MSNGEHSSGFGAIQQLGPRPPDASVLLGPEVSEGAGEPDGSSLVEYWRMLARHKWIILALSLLGLLAGFALSLFQAPAFSARTTVEFQEVNNSFLNLRSMENEAPVEATIQTQIRVLRSQSVLDRAVDRVDTAEPGPNVGYDHAALAACRRALRLPKAAAVPKAEALARAARSLRVVPAGRTRVLELTCESTNPILAAEFLNALAQEYIDLTLQDRWHTTQRKSEWLGRQLGELRAQLEKSAHDLETYARGSGLMFTGETETVAEQKLRRLQDEISTAQADRIAKQSRHELAKNSPAEVLPEIISDPALAEHQKQLTALNREAADLGALFTPTHYRMQKVRAQIAEVSAALKQQRSNVLKRIQNEYEGALRRERLLEADYATQAKLVSGQAEKKIRYHILKREVDTNRQLYEAMFQRGKEVAIFSAMQTSNVRVLDPAKPEPQPIRPDPVRNSLLGWMAGLLVAIAAVLMRERADPCLRAPGELSMHVKVPELGVIPSADADRERSGTALSFWDLDSLNGHGPDRLATSVPERVELVTWQRRPSLLAESFRAAMASILLTGQNGDRPSIIVVTSSGPMEGKTTVCSNLGIALAEINRRVLLLDCDMRRPQLHGILGVTNSWGVSDLLGETRPIDDYPLEGLVRPTKVPGLSLLPSGPGPVSISNLLYSPRLEQLLRRLKHEFDTVLIDTPPVLQFPDCRVVAKLAEAVILVCRAGYTNRSLAAATRRRLEEDGTPILGAILNDWRPRTGIHAGYDCHYYHFKRRPS